MKDFKKKGVCECKYCGKMNSKSRRSLKSGFRSRKKAQIKKELVRVENGV